jgi:hypothetical protein
MLYFIRIILTNVFRLVIRPSSGWYSYYINKFVVNCVTIRLAHHTDSTSPTLRIKTRHITALVITPQTLNILPPTILIIFHFQPIYLYYSNNLN